MGWLDGGLNGDPDSSVLDTGLNGDADSNVLDDAQKVVDDQIDKGINRDRDSNVTDTGITGEEDSHAASLEGAGDAVSNLTTVDILNDAGQGTAKLVTGEDSADDAASTIQDYYTAPKQYLGQNVNEAVEGTAADNWLTDKTVAGLEWGGEVLLEAPVRGATQMAGIDPKTGEAVEQTDPELAGEALLVAGTMGSGNMIKGIYKGGTKGLSKVDDLASGSDEAADFSQRVDGLIGQSNSIDEASTKVDVDPRFSGHVEDMKSAGDLSFLGTKTTREGAEETTSAWSDVLSKPTVSSTADALASGGDELSTAIRGVLGKTGSTLKTATSTTTGKVTAGALGIGTGVALTGTGLNAIGALPDIGGSEVSMQVIEHFEHGGQLVEFRKGESVSGYTVIIGRDEELGLIGVLTAEPDVKRVPAEVLDRNINFESQDEARDAYHAFIDEMDTSGRDGPMGVHNLPKSDTATGGLEVPESASAGQPFKIAFSLVSDIEAETTIKFGLSTQSGIVPLGSKSLVFGAGEEISGSVDVPRGATSVAPGEYPVVAFAMDSPLEGIVASTRMQITEGNSGPAWEAPEVVKELDHGWVLMQQVRKDGSETRFVVAAKNSAGQTVYLHPDGRARAEPYTYSEPEEIAEPMATYSERVENETVDENREADPTAGRPDVGDVNEDLGAYDQHSIAGMASRIKSAVTSGPALIGLGMVGLVLVGLVILG